MRIEKLMLSLFLLAIISGLSASDTEKHVLLRADFNETVCAESRDGSGKTFITAGITKEKDGRNGTPGLNMTHGMTETENGSQVLYSPLLFKTKGNFSSQKGRIEFYVKLCGLPKDGRDFMLPLAGVNDWLILPGAEWALEGCNAYAFLGLERKKGILKFLFAEYRGRVKYDLSGFASPDHKKYIISALVRWMNGEWHHVAVSWTNGGKVRCLFLDGKLTAKGACPFTDPSLVPGALQVSVGGVMRRQQPLFRCILDDFRVLDTDNVVD
jgi:hypothetical protein